MTTERVRADLLIQDLKTKSDKIRALSKAGYSRTDISEVLGIRYQHVRKVLLDAGISIGLRRRAEVPQPPIPVADAPRRNIPPSTLLEAGFRLIGEWAFAPAEKITLEGHAPDEPGIYAFVLGDVIVYVGVTLRSLQGRMRQYRRGDPRQRTSCRVNGLIKTALESGQNIKVLTATPEACEWNGLPVNTSAGMEVALIQLMKPEWNI
jgi:hypothetical protein